MENNLIKIQTIVMKQMERLNDNTYMQNEGKEEIARANALSQNATVFIKTINIGLRIIDMQQKFNISESNLKQKIGI